MKYLIRGFMAVGLVVMLMGMGGFDSDTVIVPFLMMMLGIGMVAFGGYIDSYYEWCEKRRKSR